MRIFYYIVFLLIMLFGITFAALNATPVTLNYYLGSKTMALSLLLVLTIGVGVLMGLAGGLVLWFKVKKANFSLKARLKIIEQEVANLRSLPITGE